MCFNKNLVFVIRRYWYITKILSTLRIYVDVLEYVGHIRRHTRLELTQNETFKKEPILDAHCANIRINPEKVDEKWIRQQSQF